MVFDGLNCAISNDPEKYDYCVGMKEGYVMVQTIKDAHFARITIPEEILPKSDWHYFIKKTLTRILDRAIVQTKLAQF